MASLDATGVRVVRAEIRKARELVAAARMIGDSEAVRDALEELSVYQRALAAALVDQAKERKRGVPKADESKRKPA